MTTLAKLSPGARSNRTGLLVDRIVPVLLVAAVACFAVHKIVAHDVWWQLATGEWILANGVPRTDPFSYFAPARPWIEMRWLYCITLHLIHKTFGLNALILAKTALLIATFALLWWLIPGRRRWAASLGVVCALAIAHTRFQIRPELVTYLLLVVTLLCLYRYKAAGDRRWIYSLLVVQVVWTNTHTLFVLGPAVLWIFVACEWLEARLRSGPFHRETPPLSMDRLRPVAAVAALATVACLVNPYILEGALFPVELFREIRSGNVLDELIDEFRSPFELAGLTYFFVSYLLVAAVSAASFWANRRRASLSLLGIWAAFFYLSVLAQRNLSLFGIVAGLTIAANLSQADEAADLGRRVAGGIPWAARAASLLFVLVMVPAVASDAYYRRTDTAKRFGFGVAEHRFPIRAMAFVRREGLPVPVLNGLGDGGYVLFEGGPKSVFVDGRLEVYGAEILRDALKLLSTGEGVDALADRLGIKTCLVRYTHEPGLLQALARSSDWVPVYFDTSHVVFMRASAATRDLAERLRIDWQQPLPRNVEVPSALAAPDWLAGLWPKVAVERDQVSLGQLFVAVGNLAEAQKQFEEALSRDPGEETANLYLGLIYRATGREAEAAGRLAQIGSRVLERPAVQTLAGSIFERAGNAAAAVNAYQRAVSLGDRSLSAYAGLARAGIAANSPDVVRAALLEIVKINPNDPGAWNNLGVLAGRSGAPQDALRYFETSLRLNPNQPAVLNQVGVLRLQVGDAAAAREAFSRAVAVDPGYEPARKNLQKMAGGQ
jgi:tetratricopeptide (TPR) repeat protein